MNVWRIGATEGSTAHLDRAARDKQLKIVDFIAKATGSKRETVLTTIAAEITRKHGQTPAQLLNARAGKTVAGVGSLAIISAGIDTIIEIIQKIIALFPNKKGDAPDTKDAAPDANDFEGTTKTVTTTETSAITKDGGTVTIPTPSVPDGTTDNESDPLSSQTAKKGDNTALLVGGAVVVALVLLNDKGNKVGYTMANFGNGAKSKCNNKRWSTSGGRGT